MRARDLTKGIRVAGTLPPVEGVRDEHTEPVVTRVRRRNQWIVVTWPDGSKAPYHPDTIVEVAR